MVPLDVYSVTMNSIEEEKWQRFHEMQDQYLAMQSPRIPLRQRLMHAGGRVLVAAGNRLQQSSGLRPQIEGFDTPCLNC